MVILERRSKRPRRPGRFVSSLLLLVTGCSTGSEPVERTFLHLAGAGDIASCDERGDEATAALLRFLRPNLVFTTGDNAYPVGDLATYRSCYGPAWGRFLPITLPVMGNHDVAGDFLRYFGRDSSFYTLERGGWSIVVLDSTRSPREQAAYLASLSLLRCSVALWHHPHWTSRRLEGVSPFRTELWDVAVGVGVDVVLNGHNHVYERFREQGVRQFTVGTGGKELYEFQIQHPGWEFSYDGGHGVLSLRLFPDSYEWAFMSVDREILDGGRADCA